MIALYCDASARAQVTKTGVWVSDIVVIIPGIKLQLERNSRDFVDNVLIYTPKYAIIVLNDFLVGDPGIEPGMGLPGGVTVRCRTLQHVTR